MPLLWFSSVADAGRGAIVAQDGRHFRGPFVVGVAQRLGEDRVDHLWRQGAHLLSAASRSTPCDWRQVGRER